MSKSKIKLLDDSDEEDISHQQEQDDPMTINKEYADRYQNWRRLEELQKVKDLSGNLDESDTSSSESEAEWTKDDELNFLKTLGALKSDDTAIYNDKKLFFDKAKTSTSGNEKKDSNEKKKKKEKPMFLKDYERKLVMEKEGQISSEDEDEDERYQEPGYFEQQEQIRKQLRLAADGVSDDDDELLVRREKSSKDDLKEEEDYTEWLKTQPADDLPDEGLISLKKEWNKDDLDDDEKFLRDYLLNKDYEPNEHDVLPTYDEIVSLEKDERELNRQREFESKYNFRYEEPDHDLIKQYPRTVRESVRTQDTKRKEKREDYKERKAREKEERKKELREAKDMKRQEIEHKLQKLKKLAGEEIAISLNDLQDDFDPKKYDERMKELFDDEYYKHNDEVAEDDNEKPVFSDIEGLSDYEDYDAMEVTSGPSNRNSKPSGSDDVVSGNEEAEDLDGNEDEDRQSRPDTSSRRKRKRNSKFLDALKRKKPEFDPNEKTFEEYFNEYYALDYEDIIGDTVTRFKYRNVVPNDYGLGVGEILGADDKQLNAWASLKKTTSYRPDHEEIMEVTAYRNKAQNIEKKDRIFSADKDSKKDGQTTQSNGEVDPSNAKREKRKRNKKKKRAQLEGGNVSKPDDTTVVEKEIVDVPEQEVPVLPKKDVMHESVGKKKRTRRKKSGKTPEADAISKGAGSQNVPDAKEQSKPERVKKTQFKKTKKKSVATPLKMDDERLKAYGLNPKKFKNKLIHRPKILSEE